MTQTTQQQREEADVFLDLALADDELVRAEFDALIAACWEAPSEPPLDKPCPPVGGWAARPPPSRPHPPGILVDQMPTRRPLSRERGPPHRSSD